MNITVQQRGVLMEYVRAYKRRGTRGCWWDLALAIEAALAEIDGRRERNLFRHGAKVVYKKPNKHQTKRPGIIQGHPRAGSRTTYVAWPDGIAGHVFLDELKVVP